jgi:hypothetical protein
MKLFICSVDAWDREADSLAIARVLELILCFFYRSPLEPLSAQHTSRGGLIGIMTVFGRLP